ncbi:HNH endonuclease [Epilithonimonas zeae]|uniref:HNH endonuclease n=1 Tax=Epilithonimonas zeae TaxID=1416779 RepID=UPI00200BDF7A|nr:HNH endonuclease [Epilithonimonas zeae]UQB70582.1 HNH endonuclease [Epilithonimonas zeae]
MPDLGRWFGMDKLSETYHSASPYAYVLNNPIMMYDPDGRKVNPTKDGWEFTGDDISSVYDYLNGGGNVGMLTHALSAWGDMRTGQDFWSYFSSWNGSGNRGRGGSIYTTTASDGPVTGNAHDIQGIIFTKTKIAQTFSDTEIIQNTQASWRTGGGVVMMDSVFDVLGIALAKAEPKNKNLAILLGGLAIVATKGRAAPSVLRAESRAEVYSVAYEMKLADNLYPGKSSYLHFKSANTSLAETMAADAKFAESMSELGVTIPRSSAGSILGKSPTNWVWHHDIGSGMMQLVPKSQHTIGSSYWGIMHPGGKGGMSIWGGGY